MGLDLVELVIRFENAFGIAIPDEIAADLTTPRKVTDYVYAQLKRGEQQSCLSQGAFYLLRKEFVPALGIQRTHFRPGVKLARLIPAKNRQELWTTMRSRIGEAALPDLARPVWMFSLMSLLILLIGVATFHYTRLAYDSNNTAFFTSLIVMSVLGYASARLTQPMKREFRYHYQHTGDLAKYVAIHSPHSFKKEWTREQVAELVRQIIIDETGASEFTEDSRFVEDMHLD